MVLFKKNKVVLALQRKASRSWKEWNEYEDLINKMDGLGFVQKYRR